MVFPAFRYLFPAFRNKFVKGQTMFSAFSPLRGLHLAWFLLEWVRNQVRISHKGYLNWQKCLTTQGGPDTVIGRFLSPGRSDQDDSFFNESEISCINFRHPFTPLTPAHPCRPHALDALMPLKPSCPWCPHALDALMPLTRSCPWRPLTLIALTPLTPSCPWDSLLLLLLLLLLFILKSLEL